MADCGEGRGREEPELRDGKHEISAAQRSGVLRSAVALSLTLLLIQACASGDVAAVASLVSEQNANPFSRDESGRTPLGAACEAGHVQVARYLIETGGVSPGFRGAGGATPLHLAARGGRLEVVKYLVEEKGVDPNCKDESGLKPFDYSQNEDVRKFLAYFGTRGPHNPLEVDPISAHQHLPTNAVQSDHPNIQKVDDIATSNN